MHVPFSILSCFGAIAQLVEHLLCTQKVRGSNLLRSTNLLVFPPMNFPVSAARFAALLSCYGAPAPVARVSGLAAAYFPHPAGEGCATKTQRVRWWMALRGR